MKEEKKITIRIDKRKYDFFKALFPGDSDYHAAGLFFEESVNLFKNTMKEIINQKIFNEDEIVVLQKISRDYPLEFPKFSVKNVFLYELEEYIDFLTGVSRSGPKREVSQSFIDKIHSLTEYQCYVLLRHLRIAPGEGETDDREYGDDEWLNAISEQTRDRRME
ncbi:MAG: hypothetical protein GY754_23390 [bacterium]|nr:hypothetical protein [bacterium]